MSSVRPSKYHRRFRTRSRRRDARRKPRFGTRYRGLFALGVLVIFFSLLLFSIWSFNGRVRIPTIDAAPISALSAVWEVPTPSEIPAAGIRRLVFPYSIIPGGVSGPEELRHALTRDSVVAKHYADFDLTKTRLVSLAKAQQVYVSYRVGSDVFWTRQELTLAKGETLLTDGEHMARTRCGNRISVLPLRPVSPNEEPTSATFDAPEFAESFAVPTLPFSISSPILPASGISTQGESSPFVPVVPLFPVPASNGGMLTPPGTPLTRETPPSGGGNTGGGLPPPLPPPIAVPEPGTTVLLLAGLSLTWLLKKIGKA